MLTFAAGAVLAACTFDPSGVPLNGGPADAGGSLDSAPLLPCAEEALPQLRIAGIAVEPPPGEPYVRALLGDAIELSARGSCVREGPLSYEWQISPIDATRITAEPDLSSETITVLPLLAEDYTVTLTVRGASASAQKTVLGISAYGWQRRDGLPGNQEIRDLAASANRLWITHALGAHYTPLGDSGRPDEFVNLNAVSTGEPIPADLGAAYYSPEANALWLSPAGVTDGVLRVSLDTVEPSAERILFDHRDVFNGSSRVYDISGRDLDVAVAAEAGLGLNPSGQAFTGIFLPDDGRPLFATTGGGRGYAGGSRVHDVNDGRSFNPFEAITGDGAAIRALLFDGERDELWVGTGGVGAARVSTVSSLTTLAMYRTATGTLGSDDLRALAIEQTGAYAGDVWAATDAGVARYVRARDRWLLMGNPQGLQERLDVRALAIDESDGRRTIFAGTSRGLVSLQIP